MSGSGGDDTFTTSDTDDGTIKWNGGGGDDSVHWYYSDWEASDGATYDFNGGGSNANWGEGDTICFHFTEDQWLRPDVQADMALFLSFIDGIEGQHASGQTFAFEAFDVALKNFENFYFIVDGVPIDPRAPYAVADLITGIVEAGGQNNSESGVGTGGPINVLENDADVDDPGGLQVVSAGPEGGTGVAVGDTGETAIQGTYGTLYISADGTTRYVLDNTLAATQGLDDGDEVEDTFFYVISDGDPATANASATIRVEITGADDAPTLAAVADGSIVETDQSSATTELGLTGTLAGDDVDGDTLTYGIQGPGVVDNGDDTVSLAGDYGTLTVNTLTGAYFYTPNAAAIEALDDGDTPSDGFTVTVSDGDGPAVTQTYTVNLTGADDAPTLAAVADGSIVETDQSSATTELGLTGTLAGDDVDGDTLTYGIQGPGVVDNGDDTVSLAGDYGTLTVNTLTGAYFYTPDAAAIEALDDGDTPSDGFTVTVSDGDGPAVTQTYTVNLTGADDAPTLAAVADGSIVETDQSSATTELGLTGTLAGDDVDGDTLTYGIQGPGVVDNGDDTVSLAGDYGTLTVNTLTGAYFYTPDAAAIEALDDGDTPSDGFTVTVSDGDGPAVTQTYTVNLTGADDAPTLAAVADGSIVETDQSSATTELGLTGTLAGDDVDGDTLTYGIQGPGVVDNGDDTVSLAGDYGTLTVNTLTGAYFYTPDAAAIEALDDGDTPSDGFTVTVSDGDGPAVTQTYTVNLTGADDAPTLAAVADGSIVETDQSSATTELGLTGTLAGDDVDGDTLTYGIQGPGVVDNGDDTVSLAGDYGTLTVNTLTGAYFYTPDAAAIEALDDGDTPSDGFTVTVSDGDGPAVTQTYTVNLTGADDAPTLAAVADGSIVETDQSSATTELGLTGTLAGDDVDGDTLTYGIQGPGVVDNGDDTVSLAGDYGTLTVNTLTGAYFYTPDAAAIEALDDGDTPSDGFTVTVSDGDGPAVTQTYTVNLTGADDAPTLAAVADGSIVETDQSSATTELGLTGTLAGDDVDGDTLTYGIQGPGVVDNGDDTVSLAGDYGTLTVNTLTGAYFYTPDAAAIEALDDGDTPSDGFTVTVSDGDGPAVTQTYTVNLTGADDAPTLAAVADGSIVETDQSSATTELGLTGTLAGDDVDGDTLTYGIQGPGVVDNGDDTVSLAGDYGTLTVNTLTGAYFYTPDAAAIEALDDGDTPSDGFTVTVSDGDGPAVTQTYTVNLTGADDAPTLAAVADGSIVETDQSSATTELGLTGTLAGDDVDGDTLTYGIQGPGVVDNGDDTVSLAGDYGTLTVNTLTGAYFYTPNAAAIEALDDGDTPSDGFTVTVSDGDGPAVTQTYTVNLTGADDAPTLAAVADGSIVETDQSSATTELGLTGTLAGDDVDGDTLTYGIQGPGVVDNGDDTVSLAGDYGTLTVNTLTGAYFYTPDAAAIEALDDGDTPSDGFTVTVSDGDGPAVTQTYTVNLTGADDAPTLAAVADGSIVETDQSSATTELGLTGTLAGDDVDGDTLTYGIQGPGVVDNGDDTVSLAGDYGTLTVNTLTGAYFYTPDAAAIEALDDGDTPSDGFTVTVSDGDGPAVTQTYTVNLTGADDAPTLAAVADGSIVETDQSSATTELGLTGTLAGDDVDGDTLTYGIQGPGVVDNGDDTVSLAGDYGTLTVNTLTGAYFYTPDAAAIEALDDGDTPSDGFTVTVSDGDGPAVTQTYTVNLTGADDAPVDTAPPSVSISHVLHPSAQTSTFTVQATDDSGIQSIQLFDSINGGPPVLIYTFDSAELAAGSSSGSYSHTFTAGQSPFSVINNDTHQISAIVVDGSAAQNSATAVDSVTFKTNAGSGSSTKFSAPAGVSGEPIQLGLAIPDTDEGALITVTVDNLPEGWVLNGGWNQLADGRWTIQTTDVRLLSVTTPVAFAGALVLDMAMSWTNADGTTSNVSIANNIEAFAPGNPILAWSGDDHLSGAAGVADTFVVAEPVGNVAIYSFEAGDKINLIGFDGLNSFADLVITDGADGNAVITLADGSAITIWGVGADQLTEANFVFDEVPELTNDATIEIGDGAMLPLSGLVHNTGTIEMNSDGAFTMLQLIRDGIDLDGGGRIVMSDSAGNVITGTSSEIVLTNVDNTISGAGHIGYGQMMLVNHGLIVATGMYSLEIDTGLNAVINTGTLQSTGSGGLNVHSDVVNDGLIWAYRGDITILGTVSGTGAAMISGTATATFGAAAAIDVEFAADASGNLELGDSFNFDGLISGFDGDDRLVLNDIMFSSDLSLAYLANSDGTGGTLTLSNGASVGLLGQYDAGSFQLAEDESGGTVITYDSVDPHA